MLGRLSLATKCLLLFGAAVVLIIAAALAVPWFRMNAMVDESEIEVSRQMVSTWERAATRSVPGDRSRSNEPADKPAETTNTHAGQVVTLQAGRRLFLSQATLSVLTAGEVESLIAQPARVEQPVRDEPKAETPVGGTGGANESSTGAGAGGATGASTAGGGSSNASLAPYLRRAWRALTADPKQGEHVEAAWLFTVREYRYTKAVRDAEGKLEGLIVLERSSPRAASLMLLNTLQLFAAGCVALGLAVLVFYLVTNRIILSPVRELKETAEAVQGGNLAIRSQIQTRDEFEDLAEAFNEMLTALQAQQSQLRAINTSLDEKLGELTERNSALFEAAKLKGEFLANVTHELRTPLNSILGFAELLDEAATREQQTLAAAQSSGGNISQEDLSRLAKRKRYVDNILTAGRSLLELINGLLEMAKVEAGKMDLVIKAVDVRERCENLAALMKPMADTRGVEVKLELGEDLPKIETDPRKLQQVVFNLMSNAIKFTADASEAQREAEAARVSMGEEPAPVKQAQVTLRAERLVPRSAEGPESFERVRISVLDNGPGIKKEDLSKIFDKFTQLDTGYTRRHAGTGLGLAICKELTHLLQGEMIVQSEVGLGSMFSVILPTKMDATRQAESKLEGEFRAALSSRA